MTPQNSLKSNWVWLTCVAALVAAIAWTGTSLTATGPELQTSGNQTRQAAQTSPAQPQTPGRSGDPDRRQPPPTPLSSFKWWTDPEFKKELGLSDEKTKRMDDYFQNRSKLMQPVVDEWFKEREKLEKMVQERTADDQTYGIQVWRYESLNARLRETRQVMVYRMYRELSPEQYKKLRELIDRRFNGRGGRGGPGPR